MRSSSAGSIALIVLGGAGSRLRMPSNTTAVVWPGKLWRPVAISYSTTPNENRSVRGSTSSPRACSGDMYAIVPTVVPATLVKCSGGLVSLTRVEVPARSPVLGRQLREAEVEHLHRAAAREEDVGRLDVAMQDAFGVRRVERVGDLRRDVEHVPQIERPSRQPPIERLAVEQLHREIELAFVLVEAVDRADVRMIERRRGARFAAEALDRFLARRCCPSAGLSARPVGRASCPARDKRRPSRPRQAGRGSCSARGFVRPVMSPQFRLMMRTIILCL